jgi:hypothetical protein
MNNESASQWQGWEDPNGDAMFVADGPKKPVLVRVTHGGESEHVLADFTSIEAAGEFQEWLNKSFEDTALANQRLSMQVRGGFSRAQERADINEIDGYRGPGREQ